ncbi:UDP-2,3-diacylglucosamine hydrolase [Kluyvera cryocrescens]|uniref:UDP-2,3-diacylglucosamine hydrolase n=1 Tax=Kluyvera cryocrescens TaxID=580 RepID=A0A485CHL7_KLUCR|nr:UDP-2,3-diacylglucosamine hydrolase [Kluyvera cryocrescens]
MQLLPEEKVLNLYGRDVLIMHGDTLCTDDPGYLAFRAKVHTLWIQTLFLALPLFIRRRIAQKMRNDSKAANSSKSMEIMDVNPQAVVAGDGETSRPVADSWAYPSPGISIPLAPTAKRHHRVVLGAWHHHGSMVKVSREDVELIPFPF